MRGARAQHRVASRAQYRAEVEVVFVYVWCEAETRLGGASPCRHSGMVWRWIGKNGDDVACATAHSDHWLTQQRNLPARAARHVSGRRCELLLRAQRHAVPLGTATCTGPDTQSHPDSGPGPHCPTCNDQCVSVSDARCGGVSASHGALLST
jgi:hypothetical protein